VAEVRDAVVGEYDVEPGRCERDLITLLEQLLAEGLIEVRDSPPA
jgi:Coenzyme PQQ synthesis protein D (PqqD)